MRVRHAELLDVIGRPARVGGLTIVPAVIDLAGSLTAAQWLADLTVDPWPPALAAAVRFGFDAAWVRARLPWAFGITPDPAEAEKALLHVGFVAVLDGGQEGLAFHCSDHYGRTALWFSDLETEEPIKRQVAAAFWQWLLSKPDELADFEASVYHPGTGRWLDFGCRGGEPFCDERADAAD